MYKNLTHRTWLSNWYIYIDCARTSIVEIDEQNVDHIYQINNCITCVCNFAKYLTTFK